MHSYPLCVGRLTYPEPQALNPAHASARIDLHGTNYLTFEELDTFLFSALSAEDMETLGS